MSAHTYTPEKSMDDILTSIRRVISEDIKEEEVNAPSSSNVIELTQMVQDDGSIVDLKKSQEGISARRDSYTNTPTKDTQDRNPWSLTDPQEDSSSLTADMHKDVSSSFKNLSETATSKADKEPPSPFQSLSSLKPLLSEKTVQEAVAALSKLTEISSDKKVPLTSFNSSTIGQKTLEELMRELLIPLLKNWLDANLPSLVKWIVTEEIQKIFKQSETN